MNTKMLAAVLGMSGPAAMASAQSAVVGLDFSPTPPMDNVLEITVTLDAFDLPGNSVGLAGWNIDVDFDPRIGTIIGATYVTPTAPLIDQNSPFGGDPTPAIVGNTVQLTEGLNAFSPANAFHNGGALAVIYLDISDATVGIGSNPLDPFSTPGGFLITRKGSSPLGAFTYALPGTPPFSYVGIDFEDGTYAGFLPAPGSAAVLGIAGMLGARRRRV